MHFQAPCRVAVAVAASDLDRDDFKVAAAAVLDDPGEFDVTVTLSPKDLFTDIETMVTSGTATIYSDDAPETIIGTHAGPNTTGAPTNLTFTFEDVPQTVGNTGNTWTIVIANVGVTAKDGTSHTIASISKTFPSPL